MHCRQNFFIYVKEKERDAIRGTDHRAQSRERGNYGVSVGVKQKVFRRILVNSYYGIFMGLIEKDYISRINP